VTVTKITMKENRTLTVVLLFMTVFIASLSFLRSGANGFLVNELVSASQGSTFTNGLIQAICLIMLAYTVPGMTWSLRRYIEKKVWIRMTEKFDMMMVKKRSELDKARNEDPAFQDLTNRANDRGTYPMLNLMDGQHEILATFSSVFFASIILININIWLWLIVLLGEIPTLIAQLRYGNDVWGISDAQSPLRRRYYDLRNRFFSGNRLLDLQLYQNTGHFISMIGKLLSGFNLDQAKNEKKRFRGEILSNTTSALAVSLATFMIIIEVVRGQTQIGTFLFISSTIFSLQSSFSGLFGCIGKLYESSRYVTDLIKVLETEPVIVRPKNGIKVCRERIPEIEFRNVSFSYPDKKEKSLSNFSLTIKPGEILAIVGENGAGKTTVTKLLLRVYDPTEGEVLIDGVSLRKIDLESWYSVLGVLGQSFPDYNFQVGEVISLGRTGEKFGHDRVLAAADFSEAAKFIEQFDNQYSEQLGREFGGTDVSAGQSQRLALARVSYRDAKFAILDEPTAATDARAEAGIFGRIYGLRGKISAIITSHNYANVMGANRICFLDRGVLVETGNHKELMRQDGQYARLFRLQADRFQV